MPKIQLKLRDKILLLALLAALLPTIAVLILMVIKKAETEHAVQNGMQEMAADLVERSAQDLRNSVAVAERMMVAQQKRSMDVVREFLRIEGGLSQGRETMSMKAVNQITQEVQTVTVPRLQLGSTPIALNDDPGVESPFVDRMGKLLGMDCGIAVLMNDRGDMVRVSTTVVEKGRRMVRSFIPAEMGEVPNPIIQTVRKGNTFVGPSFFANGWYQGIYQPIEDSYGKVIGMIMIGNRLVEEVIDQQRITAASVGKRGYSLIIYGRDPSRRGKVVQRPSGRGAEFDAGWSAVDANGEHFVQDIINKALALNSTSSAGTVRFQQKGSDGLIYNRTARFLYFAPWDWVIISVGCEEDFSELRTEIADQLNGLYYNVLFAGGGWLTVAAVLAFFLARKIAGPITMITRITAEVAAGNLIRAHQLAGLDKIQVPASHPSRSSGEGGDNPSSLQQDDDAASVLSACTAGRHWYEDESDELLSATRHMIRHLSSLLAQVQRLSVALRSTSTQIASAARQQATSFAGFTTSTKQISASAEEISSNADQLVETMRAIKEVSAQTTSTLETGKSNLNAVGGAMRDIERATDSISTKLNVISQKANSISSVVVVINKVADQTSLLALNASIEAAKAGDAGLGFGVVAKEIRMLSNQVAVAVRDIEHMVSEMQSSVSNGVAEVGSFTKKVEESVEKSVHVSTAFNSSIEEVQKLSPRFKEVHQGMRNQADSAKQISTAMAQLKEGAAQSSASLQEFSHAATNLKVSLDNLQKEVSRFKARE
ncbi:MAG: Cache 3/Cache 2 fusion domain-containing protein [Candidatus Methylacidiphilales bacterium]|nr:Cache 3/Cache 2 fusion domain-containing protein [Candidatus Methylacidiphilales bacterium]